MFVPVWYSLTDMEPVIEPYYHAVCSSLSKETLKTHSPVATITPKRYALRKASPADESGVAHLCYDFSSTSVSPVSSVLRTRTLTVTRFPQAPFILDRVGARQEACNLITQGQAYVCEVEGQIACLVAVTRSSSRVAAITKVVTHKAYVSQGWAKRLVRDVSTRCVPYLALSPRSAF